MKLTGGIIKTALLMVLFLFLYILSFADSLVSVKDVHYHSAFEKQAFKHYFNFQKSSDLELFLASYPDFDSNYFQEINKAFYLLAEKYKSSKFQVRDRSKKVRGIYKDFRKAISKEYFSGNKHNSFFNDNSLKNSFLFLLGASLFEELNIPYVFNKSADQISLVAFPENGDIIIETIPNNEVIYQVEEKFKKAYFYYLVDCDIINKDLTNQVDIDDLFRKKFFEPGNIDRLDFVAWQYISVTLGEIRDHNYACAYQWAEKAYLIYPDENSAFLLLYSLAGIMDELNINDPEYSKYLAKLMHFVDKGVSREQLIGMFLNLTNQQLLYESNADLYDNSYENVAAEIRDSLLFSEIKFIYNFERGKALFLTGDYNEAEPFVTEAFSNKPEDSYVRSMFFGIMMAKLEELKNGDDAYTMNKFEDYFLTISKYKIMFPVLSEMKGFRQAWLYFCLGLMKQSYKFNDPVNGEKYRSLFESDYPFPITEFSALNTGIVNAYASGANYYRVENDLQKSTELAKRGLDYLPGNLTLLSLQLKNIN